MTDFELEVRKHLEYIAKEIADAGIEKYLYEDDNDMGASFRIDENFNLTGGRIMIEYGGPTTFLDTNGMIELYWGSTAESYPMTWDNKEELRGYVASRYHDSIIRYRD